MKPIFAALKAAGCNVEETLHRFSGNEALAEKYTRKFPADPTFGELQAAMEAKDCALAFRAAHTLKGAAGNLGIAPVTEIVTPMVEELRSGNLAAAEVRFPALAEAYHSVCAVISAAE